MPAPLSAFIASKTEVDTMLRRLRALSGEHFNTHPDDVIWSDVGRLQHHAARLRDIAFYEGEYAE